MKLINRVSLCCHGYNTQYKTVQQMLQLILNAT